ncbi:MAG: ABC transporter ATP-binding protein, partial [Fusobacterium sp. JB020]|nr:ABC transporter ATP-binding protein [Fusobacterium sp. JB020]
MKDIALNIENVSKVFSKGTETVRAVDNANIIVNQGEMVTFLGPSGCGKTTTLRMVAGFEMPTEGKITIQGEDMTNTPVNKRGIGFVFQNYALFPHMTIYNNIAYGLRTTKMDERLINKKVLDALDLVGLKNAERRYPNELSGGEQQRVALARVIVMEPHLLLMDEPLSNLDVKLRIHMRTEIRKLQKKLGITCLYVTHDQAEALTVADRIVVMSKGKIEQIGTPLEIYSRPKTAFVADFIGQANIIKTIVEKDNGKTIEAILPGNIKIESSKVEINDKIYKNGSTASLVVRPENIIIKEKSDSLVKAT